MLFTRYALGILVTLLSGLSVFGQNDNATVKGTFKEEQSLIYKNDGALGLFVHSNGFGINFTRGKEKTVTEKIIFEADGLWMRHPKEYSINSSFDPSESFVYGKINTLIVIRTGIGVHKAVFPKAEKGGVEIRYLYSGGVSWGFVKPVYLQIVVPDGVNTTLKTERFDSEKHNVNNIYGTASFFEGIGQTKISPGLYAKAGLNFEFGPYDDAVRSIEVGAVFDAYLRSIPIFAVINDNNINKNTFLSFYVMISWGKRW